KPRRSASAAVAQRGARRRFGARRDGGRRVDELGGQVVVDEHVLVRDDDALDAAAQRLEPGNVLPCGDEHGARLEDDGAEDLEALLAQGGARLDDVGDAVRDAQPNRRLDRTVERSEERRVGKECRARWAPYQSTKSSQ